MGQGADSKRTEAKKWEDVHACGSLLKFSSDRVSIFTYEQESRIISWNKDWGEVVGGLRAG